MLKNCKWRKRTLRATLPRREPATGQCHGAKPDSTPLNRNGRALRFASVRHSLGSFKCSLFTWMTREAVRAYSALAVAETDWKTHFTIKEYRRELKKQYGIFVTEELHATDFVGGRGRISTRVVAKGIRCRLFREFWLFAQLRGIGFYAIAPKRMRAYLRASDE